MVIEEIESENLSDTAAITYTATGNLGYHAVADVGNYSLKSGLIQWFLRDPMVLGINILILLSLPFVAMPIL
jgi:hypothetical protein